MFGRRTGLILPSVLGSISYKVRLPIYASNNVIGRDSVVQREMRGNCISQYVGWGSKTTTNGSGFIPENLRSILDDLETTTQGV